MKKKEFLTEAKRKAIIADKEKAIIESFAKIFNSIKRIDENEINRIDELRMMNGIQAWVFNFQINHLIENLKKNDILRDYIERGEQSRFFIPMDDKLGYHPYLILIDEISKDINKPTDAVKNALQQIGQLKKKDSALASSPTIYSDISGLRNFKELMNELFYELGLNVDEDTAKKIYTNYKDNGNVQGPTSKLFDVSIDENEINENINTLANILQNKGSLDHLKNNDRIRLKLIDGEFLKKNPEWKDKSLNFLFYDARSHMVGVELIGTGKSGNAYPKELVIDLEQTNINEFEEENSVYSRMQQNDMNYEKEYLNSEDENTYKVEVIGKEAEKDGGYKHSWVVEIEANNPEEAEAKAADNFNEEMRLSDIYLFSAKVISNPTDNDVVQGRGVKLSEEGIEGVNGQSVIPAEIFQMEEFETNDYDLVELNLGQDDSKLEMEFGGVETDLGCFYLKATVEFYINISGSYRAATHYDPEEGPEEDFSGGEVVEMKYVDCEGEQEYQLTNEMKQIAIPNILAEFDELREYISKKAWEGLEDGRDDEPDRDYDDRDYGREFGGEDGW